MNNRIAVLLGIVLFAAAIPAEAQMCDFYNFSSLPPDELTIGIMDAHDESGLFRGVLITDGSPYCCIGIDPYRELTDSYRGYSSSSMDISHHPGWIKYRVEIYANEDDVPECDFESEVNVDRMRNVSIGQITTEGGQQAFYFCREEYSHAEKVDRETGEPLYPLDKPGYNEDTYNSSEEFMDALHEHSRKRRSGDYREVAAYRSFADLYLLIDSKTLLTISAWDRPLDECMEIFKNLNVTKVYYEGGRENESVRYQLIEGDRLFRQGHFEEAISAYKRVYEIQRFKAYGVYNIKNVPEKVIDNIGIALNNLGRYNESLEWFDLNKPRSYQTWNLYGQLLESMNLSDEAEYAFREAETTRYADERIGAAGAG